MFFCQSAAHAATVLRAPAAGACASGACFRDYSLTQMFSAGSLGDAGRIGAVSLDRSLLGAFQNSMFRLTFWTKGGETQVGDFGSFDLSVLGGHIVTLSGADFAYDPSQGDLMMRIVVAPPARRGLGGGGFGAFGGAPAASSAASNFSVADSSDPIILRPAAIEDLLPNRPFPGADLAMMVPEPETWSLAIIGFGLAGAVLRRRRSLSASA